MDREAPRDPRPLQERYPTPLADPEPAARPTPGWGDAGRGLRAAAAIGAAAPVVAGLAVLCGVQVFFLSDDPEPRRWDRAWSLAGQAGARVFGVAVGLASRIWFPLGLVVACLAAATVTSAVLLVIRIATGAGPDLPWTPGLAWSQAARLLTLGILPAAAGAGVALLLASLRRAARTLRRRS